MVAWNEPLELGDTVATPGAIRALKAAGESPLPYLVRHASHDWGDICDEDADLNREAVDRGHRVMSAYTLTDGETKIWIITEWDRSYTTILLPSEY